MIKQKRTLHPVRVVNPGGDNHLVCLQPNQPFIVLVSEWYGCCDLDFDSDFFELQSEEILRDGTKLFKFRQKFDLTRWSSVGGAYLGEVVVVGEHMTGSLCVVLTSEKTDVFTVANPKGTELKMYPHHILEVVLYNTSFYGDWSCNITGGEEGVICRQIGHESILGNCGVDDLLKKIKAAGNFVIMPRATDPGFSGKEHHYWFEFDVPSIRKISTWKTGTYGGGKLVFSPRTMGGGVYAVMEDSVLHLTLSVKGSNRKKLQFARRLPDGLPAEEDMSLLLPEDNEFDDFPINHNQVRKPPQTYVGNHTTHTTHTTTPRSNSSYNNSYYNSGNSYNNTYHTAKALVTGVIIKERIVADTADPLFIGTQVIESSSVVPTTHHQKWNGYQYGD